MKQFEIAYTDGTIIWGKSRADWEKAPSIGVQAIIILHDDDSAQEIIRGYDWYTLHSSGEITGMDSDSVPKLAKGGELVPIREHKQLCEYALKHSQIWNRGT